MNYNIYSLYPDIFLSFTQTSLIKKAVENNLIKFNYINWREKYSVGSYKQVDDKPYGGGSGMVLMFEPLFNALVENKSAGFLIEDYIWQKIVRLDSFKNNKDFELYKNREKTIYETIKDLKTKNELNLFDVFKSSYPVIPNNNHFKKYASITKKRNVNVLLTPRGHTFNQDTAQYLASNFDEINLICGRFEGFDSRLNNLIDLEISIGDYVTNGGEIPAMAIIESVTRLLPNFTKNNTSIEHDSFSKLNNVYSEQADYLKVQKQALKKDSNEIFDIQNYIQNTLPQIEHPIFTRPSNVYGLKVPEVLVNGNHTLIDEFRKNWFKLL